MSSNEQSQQIIKEQQAQFAGLVTMYALHLGAGLRAALVLSATTHGLLQLCMQSRLQPRATVGHCSQSSPLPSGLGAKCDRSTHHGCGPL